MQLDIADFVLNDYEIDPDGSTQLALPANPARIAFGIGVFPGAFCNWGFSPKINANLGQGLGGNSGNVSMYYRDYPGLTASALYVVGFGGNPIYVWEILYYPLQG